MRWLIILWIFAISAVAYLDRVNLSIAGGAIKSEFHIDNIRLGWVMTAFILGYALFQTPAGRLADRFGPRLTVTAGVVWWALFTVLITVVPPVFKGVLPVLLGVRFLLGAGEAIVYPASNRVVSSWIPSRERGLANGIIFAGVGFGAGVTPPLITYLMTHRGWRSAFWASAAIGLIAGAVWFLIARDSPGRHPWVKPAEAERILSGLPPSETEKPKPMPLIEIVRIPAVWLLSLSYFAYGYAAYIFFSWFFIYLSEERKLNLRDSAHYTMLPFLAMAVASPLGGLLSDLIARWKGRYAGRCGIAVVGLALAAAFIAFGARVESAPVASVVLAGGAGALYLSQSSFWSVTADLGGKSAGALSGFMNMCGQFGGATTASLTPWIAHSFGWNPSFLAAAALCAAGSICWLFVNPSAPARS